MRVVPAKIGARGIDSLPFSQGGSSAQAAALASGIDYVVGYLGAVTPERLADVLEAGLAFMAVTFAGVFDGNATVAQCKALGLPLGCTIWTDLEGERSLHEPEGLKARINAWADAVSAAGYEPGLYVGSPQP
jgi:hypothetical protein